MLPDFVMKNIVMSAYTLGYEIALCKRTDGMFIISWFTEKSKDFQYSEPIKSQVIASALYEMKRSELDKPEAA